MMYRTTARASLLKIEELIEKLHEYIDIEVFDLFAGVEGMRILGLNSMSLKIDLGPGVEAFLYLRYLISVEELEPIAITIQLKKDKAKDLELDKVINLLHECGGYLYGGFEEIGMLIPVNNENIHQIFKDVLPKIVESLFGYKVKPLIKGYEVGFYHDIYTEE
jgi:hypothetical protein